MTTLSADPSTTVLSTAWMPLDGLIQQWGAFGAEQTIFAPALHAVGMVFCALARETTARTYYTAAWHTPQDGDLTDLEHALEELLSARQYWTDAMLSLELLLLDPREEPAFGDSSRPLLVEVKETHMHTLWGDEETPPHPRTATSSHTTSPAVLHTAWDCPIYGHNWQTIGMSGEKRCIACGTRGYCPGCTPHPAPNAQPYCCSWHTPLTESTVSA